MIATSETALNADFVIRQLERLSFSIKQITVAMLDNARIHTGKKMRERLEDWQHRGLFIRCSMSEELQSSYNRVAEDYAEHFRNEMDKKPFDRKMLDWLIEKVGARGIICDMGCGPGQIARYLSEHGTQVCGVDLSPGMIECAQRLNPGIAFQPGDMLSLAGIADNSYGGIAAFYSIIHVPRPALPQALEELKRVLRPGGTLLLTFHIGQEIVHLDEWWDKAVSLDFIFFETGEMKDQLKTAGFELQEVIERDSYPEIEYPSRRAYIFARKPQPIDSGAAK